MPAVSGYKFCDRRLQSCAGALSLGTAGPTCYITRYNALILAAKPGLQALLDSCQARQPQLVEQMATMMTELEHMSVLWVEQWHIALLEMQVLFC